MCPDSVTNLSSPVLWEEQPPAHQSAQVPSHDGLHADL
jgi:hypothetical protein